MRSPVSRLLRPAVAAAALLASLTAAPAAAHYILHFEPVTAYSDTPVSALLEFSIAEGCALGWFLDSDETSIETAADDGVVHLLLDGQCFIEPGPFYNDTLTVELGVLPAGTYRIEFRDTEVNRVAVAGEFRVFDRPACTPSDTRLCLREGRFGVTVDWKDFTGATGVGHAVPRDAAAPFLANTGFVWFFKPDNYELVVKVLDGCALGGHYWVFISPASTVEYDIAVEDFATGAVRRYHNDSGTVPKLVADTAAFPCN